jgi:hypothetical protein
MLAGALAAAGCGSSPEAADNKSEGNTGSINIKTSKDGTTKVNMPGISIDADENGSSNISIGGMKINVKTDKAGNADANIEGVTVTGENADAEVDTGDVKVIQKDGKGQVQLPDGSTIEYDAE